MTIKKLTALLVFTTSLALADTPFPPCPGPGCPQSGTTVVGTAIDLVPLLFSASYNWWLKHIWG